MVLHQGFSNRNPPFPVCHGVLQGQTKSQWWNPTVTSSVQIKAVTLVPLPAGSTLPPMAWDRWQEALPHLIREHPHFLKDGGDGAAPLPAPGEGHDAVAAHVVTAPHDGPAQRERTGHTTTAAGPSTLPLPSVSPVLLPAASSTHRAPTLRSARPQPS